MSSGVVYDRRSFISAASLTLAASGLTLSGFSQTEPEVIKNTMTSGSESVIKTSGPFHSLGPLKQIDAGLLNIGYAEDGRANGPAVILLHGWPYDIYSFADVSPLLAAKGYRVIIPWLRGYGSTRFLSNETVRNGQQSVIAIDII